MRDYPYVQNSLNFPHHVARSHPITSMKTPQSIPLFLAAVVLLTGPASGATIMGNLGGLQNPTGAATSGGLVRQYSHDFVGTGDALGAIVTMTYTLSLTAGTLANDMNEDNLFRRSAGGNIASGQGLPSPSTASPSMTVG